MLVVALDDKVLIGHGVVYSSLAWNEVVGHDV